MPYKELILKCSQLTRNVAEWLLLPSNNHTSELDALAQRISAVIKFACAKSVILINFTNTRTNIRQTRKKVR